MDSALQVTEVASIIYDWFAAKRDSERPYVTRSGRDVYLPKSLLLKLSLEDVADLERYLRDQGYELHWE